MNAFIPNAMQRYNFFLIVCVHNKLFFLFSVDKLTNVKQPHCARTQ